MRNITVSLSDEVYKQARIAAAESDLSMSGLVRELLVTKIKERAEFVRRKKLQDETIRSISSFRASDRLSRDEIHGR